VNVDVTLISTTDLRDALGHDLDHDTRAAYMAELRDRGWNVAVLGPIMCPGLPAHPYDGPCRNTATPGDRYCPGCRAEFDALSADVDRYCRDQVWSW
jgi:hypothetical protein